MPDRPALPCVESRHSCEHENTRWVAAFRALVCDDCGAALDPETGKAASDPESEHRPQVQRSTFFLLVCESCGHCTDPPKPFDSPSFADPITEPMRCNDCGNLLLLAECFVAPQTTMWQKTPGSAWKHVVYPEALPKDRGRQLWTAP